MIMDRDTFLRRARIHAIDYILNTDDEYAGHWLSEMAYAVIEDAAWSGIDGSREIHHPDGKTSIEVPHNLRRDIYTQFSDLPDKIPLTSHQRVRLLVERRRLGDMA